MFVHIFLFFKKKAFTIHTREVNFYNYTIYNYNGLPEQAKAHFA